jgi:hypothetical protein
MADDEHSKRAHAEQLHWTLRTVVRWIGIVAICYFGFDALKSMGGKTTEVAFALAIDALVDFKFVASLTLAGVAGVWAVVERRLRARKTEYLEKRVVALESELDSQRSSSGLKSGGRTNPKDRKK